MTVWNIHSHQKKTRQFSFRPENVYIEKDKVVLFNSNECYSDPPQPIYIWDLIADQIHEISSFREFWLWHLDVDEDVLVTFEID